jgi:hypothetical protein
MTNLNEIPSPHHSSMLRANANSLRVWILNSSDDPDPLEAVKVLLKYMELEGRVFYLKPKFFCLWRLQPLWSPFFFRERAGHKIEPPWPDLVIGIGRFGLGAALMVRRLSQGYSFTVGWLPPANLVRFCDLSISMVCQEFQGENVLNLTVRCPTYIDFTENVSPNVLPKSNGGGPHVILDLEGFSDAASSGYQATFLADMKALVEKMKCSMTIFYTEATSFIFLELLKEKLPMDRVQLVKGSECCKAEYMALSDFVILMQGAIQAISNAALYSCPLYIYPLPGKLNREDKAFEATLSQRNIARPFKGELFFWWRKPIFEVPLIAERISHFIFKKD